MSKINIPSSVPTNAPSKGPSILKYGERFKALILALLISSSPLTVNADGPAPVVIEGPYGDRVGSTVEFQLSSLQQGDTPSFESLHSAGSLHEHVNETANSITAQFFGTEQSFEQLFESENNRESILQIVPYILSQNKVTSLVDALSVGKFEYFVSMLKEFNSKTSNGKMHRYSDKGYEFQVAKIQEYFDQMLSGIGKKSPWATRHWYKQSPESSKHLIANQHVIAGTLDRDFAGRLGIVENTEELKEEIAQINAETAQIKKERKLYNQVNNTLDRLLNLTDGNNSSDG